MASAQGIRGVTRRTTTLERQQPARQFFDAAGININGAPNVAPAAPAATPAVTPRQQPVLVNRPPTTLPPISQRIARPQVAQKIPPTPTPVPVARPTPGTAPAPVAPKKSYAKP